jgi:transposase-like protein
MIVKTQEKITTQNKAQEKITTQKLAHSVVVAYVHLCISSDSKSTNLTTVLSKTTLQRFTTNDCSYGTFKDYSPTIYDT